MKQKNSFKNLPRWLPVFSAFFLFLFGFNFGHETARADSYGNYIQTITGSVEATKTEGGIDGIERYPASWEEIENFLGQDFKDLASSSPTYVPPAWRYTLTYPPQDLGKWQKMARVLKKVGFISSLKEQISSQPGQETLSMYARCLEDLADSSSSGFPSACSVLKSERGTSITISSHYAGTVQPSGFVVFAEGLFDNSTMIGFSAQYTVTLKIKGESGISCSHKDNYNYTFSYLKRLQGENWGPLSDPVRKCEEIKVSFTPLGDWGASLESQPSESQYVQYNNLIAGFYIMIPPTNILSCAGESDCLSKATEYLLTPATWGRGVQQVSAGFIENTQKSLSSASPYVKCANGICIPYTSGVHLLSASAEGSTYYGQCRNTVRTVNTGGVSIPPATSSANINVINQPPVATVFFSKNPVSPSEEVNVTCDIIDPDDCSDKIAKVEWKCVDGAGNSTNCFFSPTDTTSWNTEAFTQNIPSASQTNPYRTVLKFKASQMGNYAVTCKAWDNDINNPLSGEGIAGITVTTGTCDADGICNLNCPYDPDCCADPAYAVTHPECHCGPDQVCNPICNPPDPDCCGADGICNEKCPYDPDCCVDPYCLPYCPGYGYPNCVIAAGSCTVIRTKPNMDITKIKPLTEVKYQANVIGGDDPIGYIWYCDKSGSIFEEHNNSARSDSQTCKDYSEEGKTYEPKANYKYKDSNGVEKIGSCYNTANVGITVKGGVIGVSSCGIQVSNDNGSTYSNELSIKRGDAIRAKITAPGAESGDLDGQVTWKFNGIRHTQTDQTITRIIDESGKIKVEANVGNIVCDPAFLDVKETVRLR